MKKMLSLPFALFIATASFAQEKNLSKADLLSDSPGVVVQKEYVNISEVDKISVIVEYVNNLTSGQKLSGLDLEYKTGSGDQATTISVLLDADEVDVLVLFIQSMQERIAKNEAPKNYTEYTFVSKSNFEAGCYWSKGWKSYFKIDKEDGHSDVEFSKEDLSEMLAALRLAKAKF